MEISTGQKASIEILVAIELGFTEILYKDEAEKFLNCSKITPSLTVPFLQESAKATRLIIKKDLVEQALKLAEKYLK